MRLNEDKSGHGDISKASSSKRLLNKQKMRDEGYDNAAIMSEDSFFGETSVSSSAAVKDMRRSSAPPLLNYEVDDVRDEMDDFAVMSADWSLSSSVAVRAPQVGSLSSSKVEDIRKSEMQCYNSAVMSTDSNLSEYSLSSSMAVRDTSIARQNAEIEDDVETDRYSDMNVAVRAGQLASSSSSESMNPRSTKIRQSTFGWTNPTNSSGSSLVAEHLTESPCAESGLGGSESGYEVRQSIEEERDQQRSEIATPDIASRRMIRNKDFSRVRPKNKRQTQIVALIERNRQRWKSQLSPIIDANDTHPNSGRELDETDSTSDITEKEMSGSEAETAQASNARQGIVKQVPDSLPSLKAEDSGNSKMRYDNPAVMSTDSNRSEYSLSSSVAVRDTPTTGQNVEIEGDVETDRYLDMNVAARASELVSSSSSGAKEPGSAKIRQSTFGGKSPTNSSGSSLVAEHLTESPSTDSGVSDSICSFIGSIGSDSLFIVSRNSESGYEVRPSVEEGRDQQRPESATPGIAQHRMITNKGFFRLRPKNKRPRQFVTLIGREKHWRKRQLSPIIEANETYPITGRGLDETDPTGDSTEREMSGSEAKMATASNTRQGIIKEVSDSGDCDSDDDSNMAVRSISAYCADDCSSTASSRTGRDISRNRGSACQGDSGACRIASMSTDGAVGLTVLSDDEVISDSTTPSELEVRSRDEIRHFYSIPSVSAGLRVAEVDSFTETGEFWQSGKGKNAAADRSLSTTAENDAPGKDENDSKTRGVIGGLWQVLSASHKATDLEQAAFQRSDQFEGDDGERIKTNKQGMDSPLRPLSPPNSVENYSGPTVLMANTTMKKSQKDASRNNARSLKSSRRVSLPFHLPSVRSQVNSHHTGGMQGAPLGKAKTLDNRMHAINNPLPNSYSSESSFTLATPTLSQRLAYRDADTTRETVKNAEKGTFRAVYTAVRKRRKPWTRRKEGDVPSVVESLASCRPQRYRIKNGRIGEICYWCLHDMIDDLCFAPGRDDDSQSSRDDTITLSDGTLGSDETFRQNQEGRWRAVSWLTQHA